MGRAEHDKAAEVVKSKVRTGQGIELRGWTGKCEAGMGAGCDSIGSGRPLSEKGT